MFGIDSFEFLVILLVAVVVLGPEKLPRVMRAFTKVVSTFRRLKTEFQRTMNAELAQQEYKELEKAAQAERLRMRQAEEAETAQQAAAAPNAAPDAQAVAGVAPGDNTPQTSPAEAAAPVAVSVPENAPQPGEQSVAGKQDEAQHQKGNLKTAEDAAGEPNEELQPPTRITVDELQAAVSMLDSPANDAGQNLSSEEQRHE